MSKKNLFYVLFFFFLVIGFYLVMSNAGPGFKALSTPPIGTVQPFAFQNQDGATITEKNMAGKVVAIEFFFTTCKGICPRLNKNMKSVYDQFTEEKDFLILSHTSDPGTDSSARLKHYADSMQVNTAQWIFLTGRKDSLYNMARQSYKIDDPANNLQSIEDDFLHTQFIALVNRKGEVVKIYDGLKQSEMQQMAKQIRKLLKS